MEKHINAAHWNYFVYRHLSVVHVTIPIMTDIRRQNILWFDDIEKRHNDAKLIKKNKSHLHFIGTKNDFLWRMSFFYNGKIVIINPLSLFYNVMIQKVDTFVDKII
jgi:hypothetical protein